VTDHLGNQTRKQRPQVKLTALWGNSDAESTIKVSRRRWKEIQEGSTFTKNAWGYYEGERFPVTWSFSHGEFSIDGPDAAQCVLDAPVAELHVEEPD
jgi:hypothetical protein